VIVDNEVKNKALAVKTRKMLVGNMLDKGKRSVDQEEVEKIVKQYNLMYIETSALENVNV
jgi:hypothetical protein